MPQLDIVPYSSEIIWLVITFFVFYFILVKKALPRLYRVLSFRKKKIFFVSTYVTTSLKEKLNYSFLSKGSMGLMITNLKGYISNVSVNVPNYLVHVSSKSYLRSWSFIVPVITGINTVSDISLKLYNIKKVRNLTLDK